MDVYINGKRIVLKPQQAIGKGGEADIFALGADQALKVFKPPTHPDYAGQPHEQCQARARLAEHQHKLPAFPQRLPCRVVQPQAFATNRQQDTILGYAMQRLQAANVLRRYAERSFRQAEATSATVVDIFRDLHTTISALHHAGVVIGDFNDLNVLVTDRTAYLIDADSFQFGRFVCRVFTARFVDPLLCASGVTPLTLQQPHTAMSDWYAFTVMLMQCLLFVGPYGGVYRPRDTAKNIPHEARPWQRLTVFHPEVLYPKPARPYTVVPDALLHYWHLVFEKDVRQPFPLSLLEALHWQMCPQCGTEHARRVCPQCATAIPSCASQILTGRGTVTARQIFRTTGRIVYATRQSGSLRWLYDEDDRLHREDGTVVWRGAVDAQMRYRIAGDTTLLGKAGQAVTLKAGQAPVSWRVDSVASRPLFDTNATHQYWIDQGQLWRDGRLGPEYIGDVLAGQTHFWVGPRFGFGLYRAGTIRVALVFDAERRGLNDTVPLPPLRGQWLGATCVFTDTHCWFLVATQVQGKTKHQCFLIDAQGRVEASAEAEQDDGSWLGTLGGKSATGRLLFAPTDAGVVRVEAEHGQLVQTRLFPDTEPFVDSSCQLFAATEGLYVVNHQDICLLTMT